MNDSMAGQLLGIILIIVAIFALILWYYYIFKKGKYGEEIEKYNEEEWEKIIEESKRAPKKIEKKWKATLIILTIAACLSLIVLSAEILDIDIAGTIFENKSPTVSIFTDSTFNYCSSSISFEIDANDPDGIIKSCKVDFGDGTISHGYSFVHQYENPGVYTVVVTVTDDKGNEALSNLTITIEESFIASADADMKSGVFPLTVSFTGTAEDALGNITSYRWDFDDGATSDEQNPSHTFEKPNFYYVILTVSNDRGENASDSITIHAEHRPHFKISGKIVNNYPEEIEVDCAVVENYNHWTYWAPTEIMAPYEEKDFSYDVITDYPLYLFWAQWFNLGTSTEGSDIAQYEISNPLEEDMVLYVEIKKSGEVEISITYHPPNPPKTPIILSHNIYSTSYYTYVFGKIKNIDPSSIKDVEIAITFYDASNNVISVYDNTVFTFKSLIGSQGTSSFTADFLIDYFHHYKVEIRSFKSVDEQPYNGLAIKNHYKEIDDYFGWVDIKGTIANSGSEIAKYVKINAIIYNTNGDIVKTKTTSLYTIYSGEEEDFEFNFYDDISKKSTYDLEIDFET